MKSGTMPTAKEKYFFDRPMVILWVVYNQILK